MAESRNSKVTKIFFACAGCRALFIAPLALALPGEGGR